MKKINLRAVPSTDLSNLYLQVASQLKKQLRLKILEEDTSLVMNNIKWPRGGEGKARGRGEVEYNDLVKQILL